MILNALFFSKATIYICVANITAYISLPLRDAKMLSVEEKICDAQFQMVTKPRVNASIFEIPRGTQVLATISSRAEAMIPMKMQKLLVLLRVQVPGKGIRILSLSEAFRARDGSLAAIFEEAMTFPGSRA